MNLKRFLLILAFVFIGSSLFHTNNAYAATRFWDGGGGADTNWSTDANWSTDTEPVSDDTVVFDATSTNSSIIDSDFAGTVTTFTVNSGYTGTITLGRALIVSGTMTLTDGTLTTSSSDYAMTIANLTIDGGTLTANGSTITLTGGTTVFTRSSGTFNAGTSTVIMNSASNGIALTSGTITFYNLQISPTISQSRGGSFGSGAIVVSNNFDINPTSSASFEYTVTMGASLNVTGTTTITRTTGGIGTLYTSGSSYAFTTGALVITAGGVLTANGSAISAGTINNAGTITGGTATITLTGTASPLFTNTGTYTLNTSTLVFSPDADVTLTTGALTLNNVTLSPTITANRTYTFNDGLLTISGNLSINPTAASALRLTVNLGAAVTVASTKTTTITGTTSGVSTLDTTGANYTLTSGFINIASAGTLTANGATIALSGTTASTLFTRVGTFNQGTSTVSLTSNTNGVVLTSGTVTFYNLQLSPTISSANKSAQFWTEAIIISNNFDINPTAASSLFLRINLWSGGLTVTGTTTITRTSSATSELTARDANYPLITGNLVIDTGGTYTARGSTITVNGNYSNAGTFTTATSTLLFAATDTDNTFNPGSSSYYKVTFNGVGGAWDLTSNTLTATNTLTISNGIFDLNSNNLTLTGATFSNNDTLRLAGSETLTGVTMDTDSGTTTYDGTSSYTGLAAGNSYYNLGINGSGGTFTLSADADVNGNLTISNGTLDASATSYGVTVAGTWNNAGTFTARSGTVTFDGSSASSVTSGGSSFYNFLHTGSGTQTILDATTVSNTFTNSGVMVESPGYIKHSASSLTFDKSSYSLSSDTSVVVTLTDTDENLDASSLDTTTVTLALSGSGDSETVTLTETGIATGIFSKTVSITTIAKTSSNGTLETTVSDTLSATYTDSEDSADTISAITASVTPVASSSSSSSGGGGGVIGGGVYSYGFVNTNPTPTFSVATTVPTVSIAPTVLPTLSVNQTEARSLVDVSIGITTPAVIPVNPKPPIIEITKTPETQLSVYLGKWNLLAPEPIEHYVFQPLPENIQLLAKRLPELAKIFKTTGVHTMNDFGKLIGATFNITRPGSLKDIPTDTVLLGSSNGIPNFNTSVAVHDDGNVEYLIHSLVNQEITLAVRPGAGVRSVKGYVLLKKSIFSKNQDKKSTIISGASLTAALILQSGEQTKPIVPAQLEAGLLLSTFDYSDPDHDGTWTATIKAPATASDYEIHTVLEFLDEKSQARALSLTLVVDPEGYVFEAFSGKEIRIPNAKVTLLEYDSAGKSRVWPAKDFQQTNPQTTGKSGNYAFLVPTGTYSINISVDGYQDYVGEQFSVTQGNGVHENIELKKISNFWTKIMGVWGIAFLLLLTIIVLLIYNIFYKKHE